MLGSVWGKLEREGGFDQKALYTHIKFSRNIKNIIFNVKKREEHRSREHLHQEDLICLLGSFLCRFQSQYYSRYPTDMLVLFSLYTDSAVEQVIFF